MFQGPDGLGPVTVVWLQVATPVSLKNGVWGGGGQGNRSSMKKSLSGSNKQEDQSSFSRAQIKRAAVLALITV